jgi:hypothetical protein
MGAYVVSYMIFVFQKMTLSYAFAQISEKRKNGQHVYIILPHYMFIEILESKDNEALQTV